MELWCERKLCCRFICAMTLGGGRVFISVGWQNEVCTLRDYGVLISVFQYWYLVISVLTLLVEL